METIKIGILIFDDLTALDAVGPYEVLSKMPGTQISFLSIVKGPVVTTGGLKLVAEYSIDEITDYDIIIIPGGSGILKLTANQQVLGWLNQIHLKTRYTVSVCTGALLLGAAGLLKGVKATTHWQYFENLSKYGAVPVKERYVIDGKIITSAGVSAGIDMSLKLAEIINNPTVAQVIQLAIEYDPDPPYDSGSPERATDAVLGILKSKYQEQ